MYAIVEISGKQYRVSKDDKLKVPRLDSDPGKKVGFDRILLVEEDNGKTTFGAPVVKNMLVNATVIEHGREKRVIVFKKKRRKGHQKRQGHRQDYSVIEINSIGAGTLKKETPAAAKTAAAATATAETKPAAKKTAEKTVATAKPKTAKAAATKAKSVAEKKEAPAAKSTATAAKKAAAPKKTAAKKTTAAKKPAAKKDKEA